MVALASADRPVVDDRQGDLPWMSRWRNVASTPAEQLGRAQDVEDRGRLRRADRSYRRLVARWPASPEAAVAQFRRAELLHLRGREEQAFDAYKMLLQRYPHDVPYEDLVERMFGIAVEIQQRRRMRLLFGGYANPESALPMFAWIVEHAPRSRMARQAQGMIARIHEDGGDYELAIEAYTRVSQLFPGTDEAGQALVRRAICLYEIARRRRHDIRSADDAAFGLMRALQEPIADAKTQADLAARLERMNDRRARHRFERARFYEQSERRPDAAIRAYRSFLREYPDAPPWTGKAHSRLADLERETTP